MRIKELFTVPAGEKVTEKVFAKVLISSLCSILLCMTCLVNTTWAWFTVGVENKDNEIRIATVTANVSVQDESMNPVGADGGGKYLLQTGKYTARVKLESDATGAQSPAYVVISASYGEKTEYYYLTFENGSGETAQAFQIGAEPAAVSFAVSWVAPASTYATAVSGDAISVGAPVSESSTETTAAATEPATEATTASATEPSAEATTAPATEPVEKSQTETTVATEPIEETI